MLFGRNQQTNQDEDETEDTSTADEDVCLNNDGCDTNRCFLFSFRH